ncbi:MAG TPA: flavodoxin family protein [Ktedonobacterales bacterium]|nr:flavodoxin family protein [Ktedonobacterales bacterium]
MNALVVYDSQYGNTERVAQSIAEALSAFGKTRMVRASVAPAVELEGVDILILGCPTQGWRPTVAMRTFLENTSATQVRNQVIACFDTRFHRPRWLTGSAATVMARKLHQAGVRLAAPPESFFVVATEGPLEPGELERATAWARALVSSVAPPHPVTP